jgi:hypothetical protein
MMQPGSRSCLRSSGQHQTTAVYRSLLYGIVFTLCCVPICANAAPHKTSSKRTPVITTVTAPVQSGGVILAPWELMALKIGSVLGALLIFWHFESVSGIRWEHSRELEALARRSQAELNAKTAEVAKAQLSTEEVRKQRDAWKLESGKPRNLYAPAELRKILGQ